MPNTVMLDVEGAEMALYDAEPEGRARGAVIVIQEAFGVTDHIEDVCRRFADEGYRAVAPHLFHRSGDPLLDYSNIEKVMPHMQALNEPGLAADLSATVGYLTSAGFDSSAIGIVGFCMGGTVTFFAASQHALGAAVTFYGGGVAEGRFGIPSLIEMAPALKTPWLGIFGDLDKGIPVPDVERLRSAVAKAPVPTEIIRYADADHGFHCDARPSYHEASAHDAWRQTLEWFDKHLAAIPAAR
jgi:carboxymethylenebutenolidase